jgi:hypothetical protein
MADAREELLVMVAGALKTINGMGDFVNDVGGRVYSKVRGAEKADETECPYLEVNTSSKTADTPRVLDDHTYGDDLHVEIAGYVSSSDSGDDFDAAQRPLLNSLRADAIRAVASLTGTATRWGRIFPVINTQWTEPSAETSDGYLVLDLLIPYVFDDRNP